MLLLTVYPSNRLRAQSLEAIALRFAGMTAVTGLEQAMTDSLAARVVEVEHRLLPAVVLALARLGVPERPVRLAAKGAAFITGDNLAVEIE